jgi:hypothetical protein
MAARAQFLPPGNNSTRSISGQFIVTGAAPFSPLAASSRVAADTNLVRLEPALLAVSAERFKNLLWHKLEIQGGWRGQIHLVLHPARSLDEDVTIVSEPSAGGWNYRVDLPDVLSKTRFARALTGVLLLEYAGRNAQSRPAEIPRWLIDGLSQQLVAGGLSDFFLSAPDKIVNGLPVTRLNTTGRKADSLAAARRVLAGSPALTFEQLNWPTDAQLDGDDAGVYRASAQLFVDDLLKLKNGPAHLRRMLESLSDFLNGRIAFESAFRQEFPRPLDLEKWWALQVVSFAAHSPGPGWNLAVSREKLDEILRVPVAVRVTSNSLPVHAEVSLQTVIRNLDSAQQAKILQTRLRDLELAQFRVAPSFAALANNYRRTLENYLGKTASTASKKNLMDETVKKLDELDAQRRTIGETARSAPPARSGLVPVKF